MLWHSRRLGLTDDDLDYMSDSELLDLFEIDRWFNTPKQDDGKPHEVVHHMTPEEVDAEMG
jgi:hypothetical protein